MIRAVIDASVAVKWVIAEAHSEQAALLLTSDELRAPAHWLAEAANAVWVKRRNGELTAAEAERRVEALLRSPIATTPLADLALPAMAIAVAHDVSIYDALYVALAEAQDLPLVTADRRLIQGLVGSPFAARVRFVGDLG